MANINDFKAKLAGGGARANQFKVTMPFPGFAQVGGEIEELAFLCRTTSLPGMAVPSFNVPFRGRSIKIAGDRTFETWTITVINDIDFSIRSAFEKWMNTINKMNDGTGIVNPVDYQKDATVHQLNRNGDILRSYKFWDVFPTNISTIDLNYETTDTVQEFTVEMQVHYWEAYRGSSSQAGGEDIS